MRTRTVLLTGLLLSASLTAANASTLSFGGVITQSTFDGTGPATNNPSLNSIADGQTYLVTLVFAGNISGPGLYDLTGATLTFDVPSAPASENSFGSITLNIADNAGFDEFSLLACLTTGSDCALGNQLTANFQVPDTMFNAQDVSASGLDQPHPLDLLEDDGVTDIHASIDTYSGPTTSSSVPEPSVAFLIGFPTAVLIAAARCRRAAKP